MTEHETASTQKAIKGAGRCPKCASRKVQRVRTGEPLMDRFYAAELEVCANCRAAWEPFDPADLLDAGDPASSFREPCGNCAFQPGSVEQSNPERWAELMAGLKDNGGRFYCHKGVPLDPGGEDGFAYPKDRLSKMRLCRGWLSMWGARMDKAVRMVEPAAEKM